MRGRPVPERNLVRLALMSAGSLCGALLAAAGLGPGRSRRRCCGRDRRPGIGSRGGGRAAATGLSALRGTDAPTGSQRPGSDRPAVPVAQLPTSALASVWRWTTGELVGHLDPRARQAIVRRRQETLDERERRDPIGLARWLAVGAPPAGDPPEFMQNDREPGTDVFGGQP